MKRPLIIILGLGVLATGAYFSFSKWAIRHETLALYDSSRNRPIAVDIAVRWDVEMKADAGMTELPVAIVSHGNTVKNTEYSFLANVLAARGYLVASIQHDLPTDAPLMTKEGSLYVGRLQVYERGEKNILFAIGELKKLKPDADFEHLTLVGHSNGGDISMFFAQQHPELVRRVVTLDNLRVPFVTSGAAKILSFRSKDPQFKTDPGVLPDPKVAKEAGIDIVNTNAQHTEMSDRGPESVKERIQATLDNFLTEASASSLGPVDTKKPAIGDPRAMGP
ncbi:MAG: alpha/beta fold hydrolase [Rhodopseudomonas sp.]|uniref:alpha/beta fold hydrolase n=1 Tax=Rhodopseudomonas sp. TaxID=1078 RepID=UPI00180604EB|nr:alpha/beta fold hydrolase [Rhodopseudomonas sp.]NVN84879.1 alpha/beta fold hydrolase [Rhodopseudomonas sp.]